MSQITLPICANPRCCHPKENHGVVCNGSLECMCEKYVEPILYEFAQKVEIEKSRRKSVKKRCEYILSEIPRTRNAGEKTFAKIYWEIWEGFRIRKGIPQVLDSDTWKRLTPADTINREKRRCKQWNDELKTYNPKVIEDQSAIFQALLELSAEE